MADEVTSAAPTGGGESSKIKAFVKKNKTLTIVAGVGGIYYLVKKTKENSGEESSAIPSGEFSEEGATSLNELGSVNARQEYNELTEQERERRGEEKTENEERDRQREQEINEREEEVKRMEEETSANTRADNSPEPETKIQTPQGASWSAHGKEFPGATGGRIAATGKQGEKAYVEYAITFPGKMEHWRYFTGSGNWENVSNSANGPTSGGGNGTKAPASQKTGKNSIGNAQVVSRPSAGKSGSGSGGAAVCPAGTVANIQKNRAEVTRLTGEIQQLQGYISAHPSAKQVSEWRANISNKQANRDQFQAAVDRGRQVPGCGNV